jgi:hypothetical protein
MLSQLDRIQVMDDSYRIEHRRLISLANQCVLNGHNDQAIEYAHEANSVMSTWIQFMSSPYEYSMDSVHDHR